LENVKGTDYFRDLSIKEGNAQIDVQEMPCLCGLDCSRSVYCMYPLQTRTRYWTCRLHKSN